MGGVLPVLLAFPSAWPRSVDRVRHGAVICVCIFGSSRCGAHFASDGRPRHLVLRALYSLGTYIGRVRQFLTRHGPFSSYPGALGNSYLPTEASRDLFDN